MKKQQSKRVIPGFGLTMGVTLAMLSIVVLIPLASLAVYSARLGFREFIEVITRPRVLSGFYVSFITAFAATVINAIMGLVLAWVLVRYDFPGKRIMDGMIELPFALPTAVAGISLTSLTSDKGLVGSFFANFGIKIAYTRIGITVALIFVGIPFVVRAIQPVLEKLDAIDGRLTLYSGNDDLTYPLLAMGAQGVISVVSNVLPGEMAALCQAYFDGDAQDVIHVAVAD